MNFELVKRLYKQYIYKDQQGIKSDWDNILIDYKDQTGEELIWETVRKRITPTIREELWQQYLTDSLPPKELEFRADGSQRLLSYKAMSEQDSKDPNKVMEINGYDPTKWEMTNLVVSEWTARSADNEELYNYQIKLTVKPKSSQKITLNDIIKVNKEYQYIHDPIEVEVKETNRAIEIGITDTHIGSKFFDEDLYKQKMQEIAEYVKKEEVEKIYIIFYGDILHVDTSMNTTIKGTQLTVENTAYDMYRKAKDVLNFTIRKLAKVETKVISVLGNHSGLAEYALMDSLKDTWQENKHITFDIRELKRKAFLYGKQLVGVFHGDMPKKQQHLWLQRDYRELWGKALYVEQHSGHLHHEAVETKGAIVARTLPTIKDTDEYEYSLGYANINRVIQTFIYDKEEGLKQINYF